MRSILCLKEAKGMSAKQSETDIKPLPFTVDSALLRELGERLVGKPHIALAELVKNSFDADATKVTIRFLPNEDKIEIEDNGHGMNFEEFKNFWMRIGSPHKQEQRTSKYLKRPMTGSKGVGRLAVQFLASKLEIRTVAQIRDNKSNSRIAWTAGADKELIATVDWETAVQKDELTKAEALYQIINRETNFLNNSEHGTKIILTLLNQEWNSESFEDLAQEIWFLQPPFRNTDSHRDDSNNKKNKTNEPPEPADFEVDLISSDKFAVGLFQLKMQAVMYLWEARLKGKLSHKGNRQKPIVELSLEFSGEQPIQWQYEAPNNSLMNASFEIRVFKLQNRQKYGVKVEAAREYLREHGGVRVYDAGFNLPHYGKTEGDWLDIQFDHARRITSSELLPYETHPEFKEVKRAMNSLPTISRLLGEVHVDTSSEFDVAKKQPERLKKGEYLKIQVSRDRLLDNAAFESLKKIVRTAIDFYALKQQERLNKEDKAKQKIEDVSEKFERVEQALDFYSKEIPKEVFTELRSKVKEAIKTSESEAERTVQQMTLLGSLATAGMTALAYEHEIGKQFHILENVAEELSALRVSDTTLQQRLRNVGKNINEWLERARATRTLFSPLMDEENRTLRSRFRAKALVEQVKEQVSGLTRGVEIDTSSINEDLRLPEGGFTEWSSIFQNVFLNAVNATLDSKIKLITVSSIKHGQRWAILVQDTGKGVDLKKADKLFEPFERELKISLERRALELGGTGLGLTIVRMLAHGLNCKVRFIEPEKTFKTAFELSWSEKR